MFVDEVHHTHHNIWGISTVGSALHSHCRGHRFESGMLHARTCRNAGPFSLFWGENAGFRCKRIHFCKRCKRFDPNSDPNVKETQRNFSIQFMALSFVSTVECAYNCSVNDMLACPRISERVRKSIPDSMARVAKVCPYGILRTNRESLENQGFADVRRVFILFQITRTSLKKSLI